MAFRHNNKVDDNEPEWGKVDKTALPRIAFADMGEEDKKSTWKFPHHWVKGGTEKDENGIWKDGELLLHRGGLIAAWAAAMGARSGQKASKEVIEHLMEHRKALGMEDDEESSASAVPPRAHEHDLDPKVVALFGRGEWAIDAGSMYQMLFYPFPETVSNKLLTMNGARAVIKVRDVLTAEDDWAGTSYASIRNAIDGAISKGAKEIVFDIDSPGGEVKGLFGLASKIADLRTRGIKTMAVVNESAYSAAYLLASAADRVVMARSGGVGSIGVIAAHLDVSGWDALNGLKWTVVSAGKYKDLLNPHRPVDESDIAYMRERVDGLYEMLVSRIAAYRKLDPGFVKDLGARLYHGDDAVKVGLVDEVLDDVAAIISGGGGMQNTQNISEQIEQAVTAERERVLAIIKAWHRLQSQIEFDQALTLVEEGVDINGAMSRIVDLLAERSDKDAIDNKISSQGVDNPLMSAIERRIKKAM